MQLSIFIWQLLNNGNQHTATKSAQWSCIERVISETTVIRSVKAEDAVEVVVDNGGEEGLELVLGLVLGQFEAVEAGVALGVRIRLIELCGFDQKLGVVASIALQLPT